MYGTRNIILDDEDSSASSSKIMEPYYLLIDTNIILDQVSIVLIESV